MPIHCSHMADGNAYSYSRTVLVTNPYLLENHHYYFILGLCCKTLLHTPISLSEKVEPLHTLSQPRVVVSSKT
jgi:hypothetical protein